VGFVAIAFAAVTFTGTPCTMVALGSLTEVVPVVPGDSQEGICLPGEC
jgi:hypothetical protein